MERLLEQAYFDAKALLQRNRPALDALVEALVARDTLQVRGLGWPQGCRGQGGACGDGRRAGRAGGCADVCDFRRSSRCIPATFFTPQGDEVREVVDRLADAGDLQQRREQLERLAFL